jgi:uncharacterized SAM-binding protein YcdF (DUF218 family)
VFAQLVISLLKIFLLPPGSLLLLALAGLICRRRWPRTGAGLIAAALVLLYAVSTPACGSLLLHSLEIYPALGPDDLKEDAGAIVVLGADMYTPAPEFGVDTVGRISLERVRYGAWLYRATRVPILTTGGVLAPARVAVGRAMASTLTEEFQVPVRWVEDRSRDTYENATFSAEILRRENIRKIFLVTSASHMRRSVVTFRTLGFEVIPAPTELSPPLGPEPGDFLPRAKALGESAEALYEWFGLLWYHLAYF